MSTGALSSEGVEYFKTKNIPSILDEALHSLLQAMPEDPLAYLEEAFRTPTPLRIIVLGTPGSGTSTLSARLAEHYGIECVSASDAAQKESGAAAAEVLPRVTELQKAGKGWVLDGFPDTRADTIQLQRCGAAPQRVFALTAPLSVTVGRLRAKGATDGPSTPMDAIARRFRLYEMRMAEVAAAYHSCLVEVPAEGSADDVAAVVMQNIDAMKLS